MDKLLIIGTDGTVVPKAIEYCKKNNIYTIITDYTPVNERPIKLVSDSYWMLDVKDIDGLEKKCIEEKINGIFAGCNEFFIDCARKLAKRLNLPFFPSDDIWKYGRDKKEFSKICQKFNIDIPNVYEINDDKYSENELNKIKYPVIVKPCDSNSSIGISKCNNAQELKDGINIAVQSSPSRKIIVEDFIEGPSIAVFFYCDGVKTNLLTVVDTVYTTYNNHRLHGGYTIPSKYYGLFLDSYLPKFNMLFDSIEMKPGMFLVEAMYKDNKLFFIEMNARISGDGFYAGSKMYDYNFVGMLVDYSLNRKPKDIDMNKKDSMEIYAIINYYCSEGKIDKIIGLDEILKNKNISIVFERAKKDYEFKDVYNMLQVGYYFYIHARNSDEYKDIIEFINRTLHIIDVNGKEMLILN